MLGEFSVNILQLGFYYAPPMGGFVLHTVEGVKRCPGVIVFFKLMPVSDTSWIFPPLS